MEAKDIIDAYCRIRTIDQTIPDDVLDFMKDAAIGRLGGTDYDKGYAAGYSDATREACKDIHENYHPNDKAL